MKKNANLLWLSFPCARTVTSKISNLWERLERNKRHAILLSYAASALPSANRSVFMFLLQILVSLVATQETWPSSSSKIMVRGQKKRGEKRKNTQLNRVRSSEFESCFCLLPAVLPLKLHLGAEEMKGHEYLICSCTQMLEFVLNTYRHQRTELQKQWSSNLTLFKNKYPWHIVPNWDKIKIPSLTTGNHIQGHIQGHRVDMIFWKVRYFQSFPLFIMPCNGC